MLKDLSLAILLGALLGFGSTGIFFALKKKPTTTTSVSPTPAANHISPVSSVTPLPTSLQNTAPKLTISSPEPDSVVSASPVTLSGQAPKNSLLIIQTPVKVSQTTADNSGAFSVDIDLDIGANLVSVTAVDNDNHQVDLSLIITYSTAKF
jgi:hypothetical protein